MAKTPESFASYSAASKARQAKIPPEVRRARMSQVAKARWAKTPPAERRKVALMLVEKRLWNKIQKKTRTQTA